MADQDRTGIMLDSLSEGRRLYVGHCGSCHNLYLPGRYDAAEWEKNVNEMQEKGQISDSQKAKILTYLKTGSKI
jgi:mono/diheme cytochrome c family protein